MGSVILNRISDLRYMSRKALGLSVTLGIVIMLAIILPICLVSAASSSSSSPHVASKFPCTSEDHDEPIYEYFVNLDLPPKERWLEPLKGAGPRVKNAADVVRESLMATDPRVSGVLQLLRTRATELAATLPAPYRDELVSVAQATRVPLGDIVGLNVMYEVLAGLGCASIVAQDASGEVLHARNLDYG